jgi:NhaA family Na+:H+ antiporter
MTQRQAPRSGIIRRSRAALAEFLSTERSGGLVLFAFVLVALVWANLGGSYAAFWERSLDLGFASKDLRHWVNDGLMAIFFFVVGLEIKRELVTGELRDRRVAAMPLIGAIGGMALPALAYFALNASGAGVRGWAIPMATDIAFVVGVVALLGPRVPDGLKVFLLALAIIDDIGAIAVIAIFYSGGIHPTVVAVAIGLLVPARPIGDRSILEDIERKLHPISSYLVIPLFGLANAGVALTASSLGAAFRSRVVLGIVAGLLVGKTVGIFVATRLGELAGAGRRPSGVRWTQMAGASALCGIGFTVSLFIARLAFDDTELIDQATIGVLIGSVCSATLGAVILRRR